MAGPANNTKTAANGNGGANGANGANGAGGVSDANGANGANGAGAGGDETPFSGTLAEIAFGKIGTVEIELGDSFNRSFAFSPTGEIYRGAWLRRNLNSDQLTEVTQAIPDIPGIRIIINATKGEATIYDPLALPANEQLKDTIVVTVKEATRKEYRPMDAKTFDNMNADAVKTWLYWMARLVVAKQANVTKGVLPALNEIEKLPARTRMSTFDSSQHGCKYREDWPAFMDMILRRMAN